MSLYDLALTVPWAMTSEALEAMLSIAARDPLPREEIAARMYGPRNLSMRLGTRRDDSRRMTMRDGVAVIRIDGPIYRYADMFTDASGGVTTDTLALDLGRALDDPAVRAILLAVDSPGGEAIGIGELADAIAAGNQRKPIGAYIEGYGASAAYWLASAAEVVGVDASALVGSIGTVLGVSDPTKRQSARIDFVSRQSPKKRPDPTSESGRAVLQQMVDDLTEVFIQAVMRQRGLTYAQVTALEGGMLIGAQAVDAGFADMVTSEETMLTEMRKRADTRQRMSIGGTKSMDWKNFWGGLISAANEAPVSAAVAPDDLPTPEPPPAPAVDVAKLEAEIAQLKAERVAKDAALFADAQIREGKALPAEREALERLYAGAATLNDGGELLGRVTALYANRPAHVLTEELLPVASGVLPLDRSGDAAAREQAEAEKHLASTPLGRAVLARRQK